MKVNDHFVSIRRCRLRTVKLLRRPSGGTNFWPIAALLCSLVWLMSAPVNTESANFRGSTSLQSQVVPIGILFFQDESGMNAPADLGQKIAKDLQQKLAVNYKDVLPRMLNAGLDPSGSASMNVEQVVTLGKQHGVKFVVRGGLLAVTTEKAGEETKIGVQLYASITSVESASENNVRAEGSGTQTGPVAELSAVDLKTAGFRNSALDRALSAATDQLASSIRDALAASASTTAETIKPTPDSSAGTAEAAGTAETEATQAAAADQELQQLIAQAESTLAGNPNSSTENINALRQSLEGLKSALAVKASRLQENKDTGEADQEIATRKQEMQTALANLTAEASASDTSAQQPSGEKKGLLARIGDFASEATSLLQKIQELRSTLRSLREDQSTNQGAPQDQTSPQDPGAQTEQTTGEVTGTISEDGNPVGGAVVTNPETGASDTTDINGTFNLKGLTAGRLAQLTVTKNGRMIGRGQVDVLGGRAAIADFQTTSGADGRVPVSAVPGVLSSTIVGNRSRTPGLSTGTLKGVVRDATGRPAPFALVQLPGVGMARTNAQGQYSFVNVPVGLHQVTVRQSGMKPKSTQVAVAAQTSVESRTQFAPADTITKSRQSLMQVNAGTVLRGTVLDNQTQPLAGAKISVSQAETTVSVITAPIGTYELRNLKPGSYTVSVYKVGYQVASQAVTLKAAATEQRNFQLSPLASAAVNKLIKNAIASQGEVRGVVRTQTGTPISNASIEVRSPGRTFLIARALTNSRGEYAVRLAEGSYDLKARQQPFQDDNNRVSVRAGGATRSDFELRQTRTSASGNLVNTTTIRPLEPRKGQLAGRVTDANGKPVEGAVIGLQSQRRTSTDQAGNYTVAELTPDSYRITVIKAGFNKEEKTIDVRGGISTRQDFVLKTAGGVVRDIGRLSTAGVVLTRSGRITGRVIDGKTGAPLAGVNVSIAGQRSITTGANGSYDFTSVAPGTYQVTVRKSGFTEGQKSVTVRVETVYANFALTSTSVRPNTILRRP